MIAREVRAAGSAVVAVTALQCFVPLLLGLSQAIGGRSFQLFSARAFASSWTAFSVVMLFLLGVLCGGEEEENHTADFARRLPVPALRILGEKICGSLIAFALWVILSLFLTGIISVTSQTSGFGSFIQRILSEKSVVILLSWGVLLYAFGLAAGAWIRKVILAAVIGGLVAWAYGFAAIVIIAGGNLRSILIEGTWPISIFWCGAVVALIATVIRYLTREGT